MPSATAPRSRLGAAGAIAWLQPFPLLAFPGLFEEKLHAARRRHHRQNVIRSRSEEWLELAS